jgi:hypothetical protein
MLNGCTSARKDVPAQIKYIGVPLGPLPQNLNRSYADPGVKEGEPLRSALANNRQWAKQCHVQHEDFKVYYNKLRAAQPALSVKPNG